MGDAGSERAGGQTPGVVIQGARCVDVEQGKVSDPQSIVVRGGRIWQIGPVGRVAVPPDAEVVDADGKYALPGLIDMHVHYRDWVPELFVTHGVTSVRDMGNQLAYILSQRKAAERGWLEESRVGWSSRRGPRIFVFSALTSDPLKGHHVVVTVDDDPEAVVAELVRRNVDGVKLHMGSDHRVAVPVIAAAHAAGLRVSSHPSENFVVTTGIDAGLDCVEHSMDLPLLDRSEGDEYLRRMIDQGTHWCPTITIDESGLLDPPPGWGDVIGVDAGDAERAHAIVDDPRLPYLPDRWRAIIKAAYPAGGRAPMTSGARRDTFERFKSLLQTFVSEGGRLLTGSDACFLGVPGLVLHQELAALVEHLDFAPAQALRTVTSHAADFLGRPDLGRVAPGATADLVLVDADPLTDIRATRQVAAVMQQGRWVSLDYSPDFAQLLPRPQLPNSPLFADFILEQQ